MLYGGLQGSGKLARGIFIGLLKAFDAGNRGQNAIGGFGYHFCSSLDESAK